MISKLWPVLLLVMLTELSKTISFTIDKTCDSANTCVSHVVTREIHEDGAPAAKQEHKAPMDSSEDSKGVSTSKPKRLKEKFRRSNAESVVVKDTVPTYEEGDVQTHTTKEEDVTMTSSTPMERAPTTTSEEHMPTIRVNEERPPISTTEEAVTETVIVEVDTFADVTTKDVPTTTDGRHGSTDSTEEDVSVSTAMEDILIDPPMQDQPMNYMEKDVLMNTTMEDMSTNVTTTELPIGQDEVVFARSGDFLKDLVSSSTTGEMEKFISQNLPDADMIRTNITGDGGEFIIHAKFHNKNEKKEKVNAASKCVHCCPSTTVCCPKALTKVHDEYRKILDSLLDRLDELEDERRSIFSKYFTLDCSDMKYTRKESGPETFYLEHGGKRPVNVLCDMETDGGGWTVVQRRDSTLEPIDFDRGWQDYKIGFGTPETDYWVGLQNLRSWTNARPYELRVDVTDYDGQAAYAHYRRFYVDGEDQGYRLHVSGYRGTAGDAFTRKDTPDNYTADGMMFTTYDRDNDLARNVNCAVLWTSGGWWYNRCSWSNLNGPHWRDADDCGVGINWHTWRNKEYLRSTTMMIRPTSYY